MAFYSVSGNKTEWVTPPTGESPLGPLMLFDSDLGRPVWRHPEDGTWVDAAGNVVGGAVDSGFSFDVTPTSGLVAAL